MYVNSFFPPDQKEYNGLLDDNGKASFNIYLYGPAQAILMVGDELSYGYILLDPDEKTEWAMYTKTVSMLPALRKSAARDSIKVDTSPPTFGGDPILPHRGIVAQARLSPFPEERGLGRG